MNKIYKNLSIFSKTMVSLSLLASVTSTYGDDTELFHSVNVSKPNLLFVLDYSGSMTYNLNGNPGPINATNPSRVTVLRQAVKQVLLDAPDNVNIGLMRFGPGMTNTGTTNEGLRTHGANGVAFPLTDINAKASTIIQSNNDVYSLNVQPNPDEQVRSYLSRIVENWNPTGGTPLVEALYEAALYFRGEKMRYGYDSPSGSVGVGAHPSTYHGNTITNDLSINARNYANAPRYKSPIHSSCQANYIVLMSDGRPSHYYRQSAANSQTGVADGSYRGPFAQLLRGTNASQLASSISGCVDNPSTYTAGKCGPEITNYIANNDNISNKINGNPAGLDGDQLIKTYTIGFGANMPVNEQNYLRSLETIDDDPDTTDVVEDGYFSATNPSTLADAFSTILAAVAKPKGTLASPGYSVSVKKGLEHEKDIYIPVFDRKNSSRWVGNLKKYRLDKVDGDVVITDKFGTKATDSEGTFKRNIIDVWSKSLSGNYDGRAVDRGGVSNLLDPNHRNIYSNLTGNSNVNLSNSTNHLQISNINNLSNDVLGLPTNSSQDYREKIVNFMRGWEDGVKTNKRYHMGDMLHSEPLVVTFKNGQGVNDTGKLQYIFAGTNEGYLHAFDTATGEEIFAFIPADLLKTISEPQFLNEGTEKDHKYGIDGAITGDIVRNSNGVVTRAVIYFGLRRGGTAYYALDVTDINKPKLLWKKSAVDHPSMGQSWSTPNVATVGEMGGVKTEVVIVSGGYDEDEDRDKNDGSQELDDSGKAVIADVGNDILIFEARGSGRKVWALSDNPSDRNKITSSIAGGLKILDTNNNKIVDRIYFGDTGGNVWRVDLSEHIGDSQKPSTLTKIAALGGNGANNRMFFNEPDVALMKLRGRSVYAVSIGSGFRPHPLDEKIKDKFYVLLDESPFEPIITTGQNKFTTITESDLANIVVSKTGDVTQGSITKGKVKDGKMTYKRGWRISVPENGEKILANSLTINGSIVFPTLLPKALLSNAIDHCAAPATHSRAYAFDILTGKPKWDMNESKPGVQVFSPPIGSSIISLQKIFEEASADVPVLDASGNPTGEVTCYRPVGLRGGKKDKAVVKYDACRMESLYWSDPEKVSH